MLPPERRQALDPRYFRSGQFARQTAVSVRTLRFYDQVGLLAPSGRTDAGYRLYTQADLVRLQQILALKFLGFSLDEIKVFLAASPLGLREALAQQKAMLRERRAHFDTVIRAIERAERLLHGNGHDWESLVNVIRAIQMEQQTDWRNKYFTAEQLEAMEDLTKKAYSDEARRKLDARPAWTEADQQRVDAQYADLYAGVKRAVAAGQDPGGPDAQALAGQAIALIEAFTLGDPDVSAGLQTWWQSYSEMPPAQRPFQSPLSEDEAAFLDRAKAIFLERRQDSGA
jgi:DNA-binding transcriptional MerR regulator